jgi:hypothetical protein
MGGENGNDEDALEPIESFFRADANAAHFAESAGERATLTFRLAAETECDATAFAVVGFSEVDELEVESEGAGKQDGALDRERVKQVECDGGMAGGFFRVAMRLGITTADGALTQGFDVSEQVVAGLLAEDLAKEDAEGTDIATQRGFFQVAGLRFEFGEAMRPAFGVP